MNMITIGKLAKETETDNQTIRYYESIGVLPRPERNESGYRVYNQGAVSRLRFIKRAKEVGFTLKEIKILISLADGSKIDCKEVQEFVSGKLKRVRDQIIHLKKIEVGLDELVAQCSISGTVDSCPTLNRLLNEHAEMERW